MLCSMNTRKSIFFSQSSVRIQLHDTKALKIKVKIENLTKKFSFLEKFIFFTQTLAHVQLYSNLDTNLSQVARVAAIGEQPCRLTKSFVE